MNNNPNGQMAQPGATQAQGSQVRPAAGRPIMYQPEQIRGLPTLTDEERTKYEAGLKNLWQRVNSSQGVENAETAAARKKIAEFSVMLASKIQQRRLQSAQRPPGQQQPPAQAQQQAQQQPRPPQTPVQIPNRQGAMQQSPPGPNQATPGPGQQQQVRPPMPGANQNNQGGNSQQQIPDSWIQMANKIQWRAPPQVSKTPEEAAKWIEESRDKYARALMTMEGAKNRIQGLEKMIREKAQGTEQQDLQARKAQANKIYTDAIKWLEMARKQQQVLQQQQQQQQQQAVPAGVQQPAAQPPQMPPGNTNMPAPPNPAQQRPNVVNRGSPANTSIQPPARPIATPQQAARQAQIQAQAQGQIQPPLPPQPPALNTALAQQQQQLQQQQAQNAQAQASAQAAARASQNSTPITAGAATRSLSHSAALTLANQRAASSTPGSGQPQGQQAQSQQQPQPPAQQGSGQSPVSAPGQAVQPQQQTQLPQPPPQPQTQQGLQHPHPVQQQQATAQAKMPIPKHLPEKLTAVPQGVALAGGVNAGRPTITQGGGTIGGVMAQPAVTRIPAYQYEAEGDHVLSKKRLDELVRQVCGGPIDSPDGTLLTPEVEENVLNMADTFVDNVLAAACRNSKERGSKVLEVRDIQLVLERSYNIRIPGYSSDELRTVRKVQPSPGWIAKMSAVQAAKVMPGKSD